MGMDLAWKQSHHGHFKYTFLSPGTNSKNTVSAWFCSFIYIWWKQLHGGTVMHLKNVAYNEWPHIHNAVWMLQSKPSNALKQSRQLSSTTPPTTNKKTLSVPSSWFYPFFLGVSRRPLGDSGMLCPSAQAQLSFLYSPSNLSSDS